MDTEAHMNLPSTTSGNWEWRMRSDAITRDLVEWTKQLNITFNRTISSKGWKAKNYFEDDHINQKWFTFQNDRKVSKMMIMPRSRL